MILSIEDVHLQVSDALRGPWRVLQGAGIESDIGSKYHVAVLADSLFLGYAGDLFCSPVEGSDPSFLVNGKDPISDTVKDQPRKGSILFG